MKPGIHHDVPADAYHALDAASSHRLRLLGRSPLHMRHAIDNPEEPTPAMVFGEAVHFACLQPDIFCSRFSLKPEVDRRTKDGKAIYEKFIADLAGRQPIARDDLARCGHISIAVHEHPFAGLLLKSPGPVEITGIWTDATTGQLCKLRADKLAEEYGTIVDLKTTDDASPDGFERSILKYGYHVQAAMYLRGMAALGRPFDHFVFVCVEKDPPHAVGVYRLDDEAVEAGDAKLAELLEIYAECSRTKTWPSYPSEVQTISLPDWFMRKLSYGRIG